MHARQQIKNQVIAELIAAATSAAGRVEGSRLYRIPVDDIQHYIRVWLSGERSELNDNDGHLKRLVNLNVLGSVRKLSDIEDALDDFAEEIETAIGASIFSGLVFMSELVSSTPTTSNEDEYQAGEVLLVFELWFSTVEGAPGTIV